MNSSRSLKNSLAVMRGMTLIELSVVLLVLVSLAGLTLPTLLSTVDTSECNASDVTLQNIRSAILGTPTTPGFLGDMNRMPYALSELVSCPTCTQYNKQSNHGWRGPYLSNGYVDQFRTALSPGSNVRLLVEYNGANNSCYYFLLSNGPNGQTDTNLSATAISSAESCSNISSNTISKLNTFGVNYLDNTTVWSRGDDRLLFIETVDPGTNSSCNQ